MKKDKKRGVAAKPGVSPETSRTPLKADLDPDFLEAVRAMDKAERKEIGDLIDAVCKSFGFPHEHKGIGLRDLGHAFYECRMGLQQRIVFEKTPNGLYFHILGDHKPYTLLQFAPGILHSPGTLSSGVSSRAFRLRRA